MKQNFFDTSKHNILEGATHSIFLSTIQFYRRATSRDTRVLICGKSGDESG
jgi:hypothetical protein